MTESRTRTFQLYNAGRLAVSVAALGWAAWQSFESGDAVHTPVIRVLGIALLTLLVVVVAARNREVPRPFLYAQLALDAVLVSALSDVGGGLHSLFTLLYFPLIAVGIWILGRAGGLVAAGFASVGFIGMLVSTGDLAFHDQEGLLVAWSEGMFRVFAFFLSALLAGQLREQLVATGQALQVERKSVQLLASERETVLDRVPAGVLSTRPDGVITSLNPFARRLLGEVEGKPLLEVFPASAGATWEERRGRTRWVCSRAPLPDGGEVLVIEDVTELERMREERSRDERLVSVGRMAASMAHEIRNPLASLSSSLQLIREDQPGRLADLALEEAERLNRLVEDFLALTRRPTMAPRVVDVTALAREVCGAFALDRRYSGRVEAFSIGDVETAEVDPDRLRQALWNLVLNGAQAMPRGGRIEIGVGTGTSPDGRDGLLLTVSDEGVGIPAEERDRVFDPFYTTRQGGTGLGLLLVEQVVSAHAGFVEVAARPQGGTVFRMWFPREVPRGP